MRRNSKEEEFDGARILSTELDFTTATDLLPELTSVVAPGYGVVSGTDAAIGDAIARMALALCGGKLSRLLPQLLKGTVVIAHDDEQDKMVKYDLSVAGKINEAFTGKGRKKLALHAVQLALEVSFRDFFDGLDLSALGIQKPSTSSDSSPST